MVRLSPIHIVSTISCIAGGIRIKTGSFEKVAKKYDRLDLYSNIICFGSLHRQRKRLLKSIKKGERLLDVGCGTGRFAIAAAKKGVNVTVIDISPTMIEIARRNAKKAGVYKKMNFFCSDVLELDLEERFDVISFVYIIDVIPTFSEVKKIIKKTSQWLSPKGRISVADEVIPRSSFLKAVIIPLVRKPYFKALSKITSNKFHPIHDIEKAMRSAGLKNIKIERNPFQYLAVLTGYKQKDRHIRK